MKADNDEKERTTDMNDYSSWLVHYSQSEGYSSSSSSSEDKTGG